MSKEKMIPATRLTIHDDGTITESYYIPVLDDVDPEMEEIHKFTRECQDAKGRPLPVEKSLVSSFASMSIGNKKDVMPPIKLTLEDSDDEEEEAEQPSKLPPPQYVTNEQYQLLLQQMQQMQQQLDRQQKVIDQQQQQQPAEKAPLVIAHNEPPKALICVTGIFAKEHRELGRLIESKGYRYSETVTRDCTYLIASPVTHTSSKVNTANGYEIPIKDSLFLATLLGVDPSSVEQK